MESEAEPLRRKPPSKMFGAMKAMGTMVRKKSVAQSAKDPSKVDVQAAAIARPISEDSSATEKCDVLLMYGRKFDVSARRPFPWPLRNERLRFYICRDCKTLKPHLAAGQFRDNEMEFCLNCNTVTHHSRHGTALQNQCVGYDGGFLGNPPPNPEPLLNLDPGY